MMIFPRSSFSSPLVGPGPPYRKSIEAGHAFYLLMSSPKETQMSLVLLNFRSFDTETVQLLLSMKDLQDSFQ